MMNGKQIERERNRFTSNVERKKKIERIHAKKYRKSITKAKSKSNKS